MRSCKRKVVSAALPPLPPPDASTQGGHGPVEDLHQPQHPSSALALCGGPDCSDTTDVSVSAICSGGHSSLPSVEAGVFVTQSDPPHLPSIAVCANRTESSSPPPPPLPPANAVSEQSQPPHLQPVTVREKQTESSPPPPPPPPPLPLSVAVCANPTELPPLLPSITLPPVEAIAKEAKAASVSSKSTSSLGATSAADCSADMLARKGGGEFGKEDPAAAADPPSAETDACVHEAAAAAAAAAAAVTVAADKETRQDFLVGHENWCVMLYELLLYKSKTGHTDVKQEDESMRQLHSWCVTLRKHYKSYKEGKKTTCLTPERVAVLDEIKFEWNVRGDAFWKKKYNALMDYKISHGNCMVPRNWEKDPKLGDWVTDQRRQYRFRLERKPTQMTDERMRKLEALGFTWRVRDRIDWHCRYDELLDFRAKYGHCVVPQHYEKNKPLGKWVAKQREQYRFMVEGKHSFLSEERVQLLDDIGFQWNIKGRSPEVRKSVERAANGNRKEESPQNGNAAPNKSVAVTATMPKEFPSNVLGPKVNVEHMAATTAQSAAVAATGAGAEEAEEKPKEKLLAKS